MYTSAALVAMDSHWQRMFVIVKKMFVGLNEGKDMLFPAICASS